MPEKTTSFYPSAGTASNTIERLAEAWCRLMHDSAMWPAHGEYQCRSCGRHYPVPWMERPPRPEVMGTSVWLLNPGRHRS
jgi:hypothetical protein